MRREKKHRPRSVLRVCPVCQGDGRLIAAGRAVECRKCRGTGTVRNK